MCCASRQCGPDDCTLLWLSEQGGSETATRVSSAAALSKPSMTTLREPPELEQQPLLAEPTVDFSIYGACAVAAVTHLV